MIVNGYSEQIDTRRMIADVDVNMTSLSLVNRSCKESLLDAIALIINYLGVPLGMAFTRQYFS